MRNNLTHFGVNIPYYIFGRNVVGNVSTTGKRTIGKNAVGEFFPNKFGTVRTWHLEYNLYGND